MKQLLNTDRENFYSIQHRKSEEKSVCEKHLYAKRYVKYFCKIYSFTLVNFGGTVLLLLLLLLLLIIILILKYQIPCRFFYNEINKM